jgi:hypothetical protein
VEGAVGLVVEEEEEADHALHATHPQLLANPMLKRLMLIFANIVLAVANGFGGLRPISPKNMLSALDVPLILPQLNLLQPRWLRLMLLLRNHLHRLLRLSRLVVPLHLLIPSLLIS